MRRQGNLFAKTFTRTALLAAFYAAAKNKRGNRGCFQFAKYLAANVEALHKELHSNTYKPRDYYKFTIKEPKERVIYAPAFRDCVVQHAIYAVISPIFERTFIDQSFACRKGFGTHRAADYAQEALQKSDENSYVLQLDIRKFFYHIDRNVLKNLLDKKIKEKRFVSVMMLFTDHGEKVGIPIGNLLSQLYALIYMNPVDQFIKRELKVTLYCRYVDDFILFNLSRSNAVEYKEKIIDFIDQKLNLELSKSTLAKTSKGVNFVGYRTWRTKRFIRKRSLYNFRQAIKSGCISSAASVMGHARKTHSLKHLMSYSQEHYHANYMQLPKIYRFSNHPAAQPACRRGR